MSGDNPLTPAQSDDLRAIAGVMIPASAEFDVPGADDPAIQADIMATPRPRRPPCARSAGRACTPCRVAAGQSRPDTSGGCGDGTARKRRGRGGDADPGRPAQCYYRDDRVVRSLGLEPRPPYPKGHEFGGWRLVATRPRPRAAALLAPCVAFAVARRSASVVVEFIVAGTSYDRFPVPIRRSDQKAVLGSRPAPPRGTGSGNILPFSGTQPSPREPLFLHPPKPLGPRTAGDRKGSTIGLFRGDYQLPQWQRLGRVLKKKLVRDCCLK